MGTPGHQIVEDHGQSPLMKMSKSLASSIKGVFTGFMPDARRSSPEKVSPFAPLPNEETSQDCLLDSHQPLFTTPNVQEAGPSETRVEELP